MSNMGIVGWQKVRCFEMILSIFFFKKAVSEIGRGMDCKFTAGEECLRGTIVRSEDKISHYGPTKVSSFECRCLCCLRLE